MGNFPCKLRNISNMVLIMKLSDTEKRILREIQQNAALSLAALAERCNMAQSTVWRKLQELDAAGIVLGRKAILNPATIGASLCVYASVSLKDHNAESVTAFASLVQLHPEIMECHALSGAADYILKIRVADVPAYETFMSRNLLGNPHVQSVVSSFSLKELKSTTELPL